jgi:TRAP-type C4-dicarboxylate transport system substrate-binding protein
VKKTFLPLILGAAILSACGGEEAGSSAEGGDTVTLSFATTMDDSGVDKEIREYFEEQITELSDGTIEMEFFMGGQIGGEREALEQMMLGELDMGYNVIQAELYYQEYNAINIPFLFPDFESMQRFMDGPIGDEIERLSREEGGIIPLGMHGYGSRWTTSNVPFSNADELQGLAIRMPEIEWWVDVWDEMGALPTPIAATEIVTALQTGTVDAQENFLTNIAGRQMWDYQDYLIDTEHIQFYQTWVISEDTWENKLNESQQEAVEEAVQRTTDHVAEIVEEMNEEFLKEIEEGGMEIIYSDQQSFRDAADPAIQRIIEEELAEGVYEEVLRAIGE